MALFTKLQNNDSYKEAIINSLLSGIPDNHLETFGQILLYVIEEKYYLFDREDLKGHFYTDDEDELQDLILPSIRRLYGKTFISPPPLFANRSLPIEEQRYKLFVLYFDIDEFVTYLIDMIIKSKGILDEFEFLDKSAETLSLIVDNYISKNVKKVRDCDDLNLEIHKMEREAKLKGLING